MKGWITVQTAAGDVKVQAIQIAALYAPFGKLGVTLSMSSGEHIVTQNTASDIWDMIEEAGMPEPPKPEPAKEAAAPVEVRRGRPKKQ